MLKSLLTRFKNDERGVTAIEYGVIGVALAVGLGLIMYGGGDAGDGFISTLTGAFNDIASNMSSTTSG